MSKTMLIDAAHDGEVRVAVVNEKNELELFDIESRAKENIKGNIYLSKVVRIEPSLQAVFVEFGGNKQGFLSFSDIAYEYYNLNNKNKTHNEFSDLEKAIDETNAKLESIETINNNSDQNTPISKKDYKVQDVININQRILVQVDKDERGNKCPSVTTYINLTGRFCILMPNSQNRSGISKRISAKDSRDRLKKILDEIHDENYGNLILRTSGEKKSKRDIKKDYDFLKKTWDDINKLQENVKNPCLIYKESCLIKRSLRDMYSKDIKEILISGQNAYKMAKEYMVNIIPSHARRIKLYKDKIPIFNKFNVDTQIGNVYASRVDLPSGGYIVINPTEALVAIDVNSGKATKEKGVEETALSTNLEAARVIHDQVILRNISGIIVIDFIDMDSTQHNSVIEKEIKSLFKSDKANLQFTKISVLGIMEISRQRLKSSITENFFTVCPCCGGFGYTNSIDFASLKILRNIESILAKGNKINHVDIEVRKEILVYLLNQYRKDISNMESEYNCTINLIENDNVSINNYIINSSFIINEVINDDSGIQSDAVKNNKRKKKVLDFDKKNKNADNVNYDKFNLNDNKKNNKQNKIDNRNISNDKIKNNNIVNDLSNNAVNNSSVDKIKNGNKKNNYKKQPKKENGSNREPKLNLNKNADKSLRNKNSNNNANNKVITIPTVKKVGWWKRLINKM